MLHGYWQRKGYEARKKFTKLYLYGIVSRYLTWLYHGVIQKCLKQIKNMRHFQGPVEHGQNLLQNLAKWTGSATTQSFSLAVYQTWADFLNMICGLNVTSSHPTKITKWTHIIIIPLVGPPKPRTKSKNSPTRPLWRFWVVLATAKTAKSPLWSHFSQSLGE